LPQPAMARMAAKTASHSRGENPERRARVVMRLAYPARAAHIQWRQRRMSTMS
jgi:hypothetical protein